MSTFENSENTPDISTETKYTEVYKQAASEMERNVAEVQSARYERTLLILMHRSDDNIELINALNEFSKVLERRAMFGDENKSMNEDSIQSITDFFKKQTEELEGLTGNTAVE